ncbi:MAG: hypothetical protein Q7J84_09335 [Sulfuricaulis sp.]|nr:hypothetical protein [Sulfuricaulis sp.]
MSTDYAIHSDFLVHWTGKDLDTQYDSNWDASEKSAIDRESSLSRAYVDRLHNILKYGLWLTEEPEIRFPIGDKQIAIPSTPKVCFTELKLSESRTHAKRYGRLGIGVKRPYLFNRFGRPLAYFGFNVDIQNDLFLKACANDFKDKSLLNFFKPMNSGKTLNYDLYGESEWRILFFQELLDKRLLIDPRDDKNADECAFFNTLSASEQARLKYLAPLDGWCALIIYPSLSVKNKAQQEDSARIRAEIARIKSNQRDHGNKVEGGNWPMEIDLDACRNF